MSETKNELKIITDPKVYLVGQQEVNFPELDQFLFDHEVKWTSDTEVPAEYLGEMAGRLCYMSYQSPRPGGNSAYISHILEVMHGSILEHCVWNLVFVGISRSLSHELVRHRAGLGFSQLSQRYVDESVAEYVEPDCIAEDPELHEIWKNTIVNMHDSYKLLVEKLNKKFSDVRDKTSRRKMARQAARSVLPNATETKIFVTANARALRHFIELRGNRHADVEIRKLAIAVLKIMQKESPNLFGDYKLIDLPDGTQEATTPYRKV